MVTGSQAVAHAAGDGDQQLVADNMRQRVVHFFEMVEVDADHGERLTRPLAAGEDFAE